MVDLRSFPFVARFAHRIATLFTSVLQPRSHRSPRGALLQPLPHALDDMVRHLMVGVGQLLEQLAAQVQAGPLLMPCSEAVDAGPARTPRAAAPIARTRPGVPLGREFGWLRALSLPAPGAMEDVRHALGGTAIPEPSAAQSRPGPMIAPPCPTRGIEPRPHRLALQMPRARGPRAVRSALEARCGGTTAFGSARLRRLRSKNA